MQPKTGLIDTNESFDKKFGANSFEKAIQKKELIEVNESEMTDKQKREQKVSLKDHRSKLGKKLTEFRREKGIHRGDPCPCNSGKVFKHCCQHVRKTKRSW